MSDTEVRDLLDRLAATAPEPTRDPVAGVYRQIGSRVRQRRRARRLVPVGVALATVAALLAVVGLVSMLDRTAPSAPATPVADARAEAATAAGREFATSFFTFDYRQVDQFVARVSAETTGDFRRDFVGRQEDLKSTLRQVQSKADANVLSAGAREVTPTSARVLLVVDQNTRNKATAGKPVVQRYRVALGMTLVNGRWLAEKASQDGGEDGGCEDPTATPDRNELLRQTCEATERLFSFDYRSIQSDLDAQRAVATGPFRDEVEGLTGPSVRPVAERVQARVVATAIGAAVVRQDATTTTVLVFANQTVTTNLLAQPRIDRNRLEVTVKRVDDRWLVSGVRAL